MITSKEAVLIGKVIVQAKRKEQEDFYNARYALEATNGLAWTALNNLWYDILGEKAKQKFEYSFYEFYKQVILACSQHKDTE